FHFIAFTLFNPRPPPPPPLCRIRGPSLLHNHVLARAEDKARGSSTSSQQQFQDLPTESGTVIPYVHLMKQAHKILRTVISPRLICSKLLRTETLNIVGTAKFFKPGSYSWTTFAGISGYAAP
ncbi:hypothetical protein S83_064335, partial [Arachis hypogaea]